MKTKQPGLASDTGDRLTAVWHELSDAFGWDNYEQFAEYIGVGYSTLTNWLNGYHPPTIYPMLRLSEKSSITLDWIYRGSSAGLAYDKSIRLDARVRGEQVPSVAQEPRAAPEVPALVVSARKKAKASAPLKRKLAR
jgi:transcriptional regulator with XRE-family HTH domain